MIAVDSVTIGFAVVGAVYVGHRFAIIARRAFYKFAETRRPDFVYLVRRPDLTMCMEAFYHPNDAAQFCVEHPGCTYYCLGIV